MTPQSRDELLSSTPRHQVYTRRWYILFVACLTAFGQGLIWNTYGPIALAVEQPSVFGWDDSEISWMGNWGPIAYIVAFMPTAWVLDNYDLRPAALVAAALMLLGCVIRLLSTGPTWQCTVCQHIGQCLNGLAGPFAMSAGTVLSAQWFPAGQRTLSTAIFCVANMSGVSASYIIGPLLVPSTGSIADVRLYLWLSLGMSVLSAALTMVYFPSRPPHEPSKSATVSRTESGAGLSQLMRNKQFWLVALSYGIMTGVYAGWGCLYTLIVKNILGSADSKPQVIAAQIGFSSNIAGNIASLVFSGTSDAFSKRVTKKTILLLLSLGATILYVAFSMLQFREEWIQAAGLPTFFTLCILAGILVNGTVPIFFEVACEAVYPVAEGMTTSMLTMLNNLAGLIFLLLPAMGLPIGPWVTYLTAASCGLAVVCMLLFEETTKRTDDDCPEDLSEHLRTTKGTAEAQKYEALQDP